MTIRLAVPADERSLFALTVQFPTPTPCSESSFGDFFRVKVTDTAAALFVAERGDRLIGYVSGYVHVAFYAGGATARIDEILVIEALRGQGVGAQLMAAFEAWAIHHNCVLVALATRGAAPFYERLGYASKASYYKKYLTSSAPAAKRNAPTP